MLILTLIFFAGMVICAIGWLRNRVSVLTLAWYLNERNVPPPTEEDLSKGARWVAAHLIEDITKRK